jgi:hypothetical protein
MLRQKERMESRNLAYKKGDRRLGNSMSNIDKGHPSQQKSLLPLLLQ